MSELYNTVAIMESRLSKNPVASVLMPVLNEDPGMLEKAISSILQQSFPDFEFIIVDDGSDRAETGAVLERWVQKDSRIRLIKEHHRGVYKALNIGLLQCRGEFVVRQDSDDWSEPDRLSIQIAFLRSHPEIAIAGSYTMTHQQDGKPLWVWTFPTTSADLAAVFPIRMAFCSPAVCFRRLEMAAIGGYREELPYCQDYDGYWRLADRSGGANLSQVLYHYRFTLKSISTSKSREQERCTAIIRELGLMRRKGEPEDLESAIHRIDAWRAENAVETDLLHHADYTMLSGAYMKSLKLYLRSVCIKPLSAKTWLKLVRWVVFTSLPPLRKTVFQAGFRTP